ncbi:hypothetical protein RRG08_028574 [Elysia crispata]|uniref:Uncharacterized protein n=1 Tax=Elysia crispata TaxID=231223 RepID=A0AAE0Y9V6_9GAST|nr:hypothetical protein RRG08_028574 [Elysia crispata]
MPKSTPSHSEGYRVRPRQELHHGPPPASYISQSRSSTSSLRSRSRDGDTQRSHELINFVGVTTIKTVFLPAQKSTLYKKSKALPNSRHVWHEPVDLFRETNDNVLGWVSETNDNVLGWVSETNDNVLGWVSETNDIVLGWVSETNDNVLGWVSETNDNVLGWVSETNDIVLGWVSETNDIVLGWVSETNDNVLGWVSETNDIVLGWVTPAHTAVEEDQRELIGTDSWSVRH